MGTKEEIKKLDTENMKIVVKDEVKNDNTETGEEVKKDNTETEEEVKEQENMNASEQCNPESTVEKHIAEKENAYEEANENIDCGTRKSTDENPNDPDNSEMQKMS